ncbi:reverse transcriptase domain-containing protein, partial [Tanacetum coccineum]
KIGFKPTTEVNSKNSTANSNGNKKKGEEPTTKVSNSNPFDVLNSVDNEVEFGTNGGTTNLVNNEATLSGSSFMNVDNSSSGTTPIIEKIRKFKELLTSGQAILVDKDGNPLKKVDFLGEDDSEDEVASVANDMARSMAYERGFGTQSLLEQWRDSYGNGDYDDDPYDDDMYKGQDLSHELQAIGDNLDIRVRGQFDIEIRDKKGAGNLAADHLSRLENPDLGKLTKAKIRDLFPEEWLMAISDKNNEPCVLTESYEGAWPKMRQHKFFDNVTTDHLEDIMASPPSQEKYLRSGFTGHISSKMHISWYKFAMHVNEQETSHQGTKHLKNTSKKDWSYKLDDALWAFRTTFKTPLGTTQFRIIYGKACHLLVKIEHKAYWAIKNCNLDRTKAGENHFLQINELDEMRLDAYETSISYKERTKRWHDKQIKELTNYEKDDKVLLFNSRLRLFLGKLKSRWYRPLSMYKDMKNGAIKLYDEDGNRFIVK